MSNTPKPSKGRRLLQFITGPVAVLSVLGAILIIIGQTSFLYDQFPRILTKDSAIYAIIKSIGAALLGSGVFTAIIKSSEYTEIFTKVVENIVGKKEFIEKRTDKMDFWRMVSRLMYQEKFPLISEKIEDIIANHYLPTTSEYYIDEYEVFVNITEVNEHFWKHHETLKITVRPSSPTSAIAYTFKSAIDLPDPEAGFEDITELITEQVVLNEQIQNVPMPANTKIDGQLTNSLILNLQNNDEYRIVLKRAKTMCKKSNPDKRFFARAIINNMKISLIVPKVDSIVDFHKMGTINDFKKEEDQVNNSSRVISWSYKGLILPHQGFIVIFK